METLKRLYLNFQFKDTRPCASTRDPRKPKKFSDSQFLNFSISQILRFYLTHFPSSTVNCSLLIVNFQTYVPLGQLEASTLVTSSETFC